jgi:hypothetical protein
MTRKNFDRIFLTDGDGWDDDDTEVLWIEERQEPEDAEYVHIRLFEAVQDERQAMSNVVARLSSAIREATKEITTLMHDAPGSDGYTHGYVRGLALARDIYINHIKDLVKCDGS